MNILYVTDKNYVPIMGTSMCSLLENNKDADTIDIYVLEDSIGEKSRENIQMLAEKYNRNVFFVGVDKVVQHFESVGIPKYYGRYSTYIRLYAGEALKNVDKCIYIDCDTLVLGRLDELWNMETNDCPSGAVIDCNHSSANRALKKGKNTKYYNAGVMLINLDYWRKHDMFDKFIQASREIDMNKTLTNSDQELINYLLSDKMITIPLKYNVSCYFRIRARKHLAWILDKNEKTFYSEDEIEDAVRNPTILHFTGGSWGRPWFSNSVDIECNTWEKYLQLTPWQEFERKKNAVSIWKRCCIAVERWMPIWMFAVLKRVEARIMVWRKCGI